MPHPPPSPTILRAFGVAGAVAHLAAGGQGVTFRAGDLAIKPCDDAEQAEWLSEVMERVEEDGFRIARPVRSQTGAFVIDGWCAARWLDGTPRVEGRWAEAIAACQAFHRAIRHVPYAPVIERVDNPYTKIDAMVWKGTLPRDERLGPMAERLRQRLRPVTLANQLVHGDPGEGNMLFAPGLPVGIIDMAAYWHPANYALAMLLADGIAWSAAPAALLDEVKNLPEMDQLLARAVLFRLHVAMLFRGAVKAAASTVHYAPVVETMDRWSNS